ncbi:Saccharopine dehydrogenase [Dipodascopsis tothii]|uniref:Saccharopine dehydrogenase n=1 Tax=Dipodascopsis tothii TaxID=44089 RepID=UPI0034CEA02E
MVKNVLLLGSGFVAKPTVDILLENPETTVTVACRTIEKAKALAGDKPNARAISLDVEDEKALDAEVSKSDLVISLIPYIYHVTVIKSGIRCKTNVLTTSYTSPAMRELDAEVKKAGITVFNEIGLDPGIDHLYAVKTINEVHQKGGKIKTFYSFCGGLPAPEDSDNPLGYKFSWSSRGVLLALRNDCKYYDNGKIVEVEGKNLMASAKPYFIYPGYSFLAYGNRDSTPYRELYGIPEAENVLRGTLRYQGFTDFAKVLIDLGFLREEELEYLQPSSTITWKEAFAKLVGAASPDEKAILAAIDAKVTFNDAVHRETVIKGFKWLGLFTDNVVVPRKNFLDTFCVLLDKLLQYEEGERDFVMLQHKFGIEWADGTTETRTSTLADYGDPNGYSSMAKLVGTPCAVAAKFMLDGVINKPGVHAPLTPEFADSLREELYNKYGIYMKEKTIP